MKRITYILVLLTIVLFIGGNSFIKPIEVSSNSNVENKRLKIITETKEQYYMVKSIVNDKHDVEFLFKNEKSIKDLKIGKSIIDNINNNDIYIYSSLGNENENADIIGKLNKDKVSVVDISRGVKPITYKSQGNELVNSNYDLSFNEYKVALHNIKSAIKDQDVENRSVYEMNYDKVINEFVTVLDDKKNELKKYYDEQYQFVASTNNFDYFFDGLDIDLIKINDNSEELKNSDKKIIYIKDKENTEFEDNILDSNYNVLELRSKSVDKSPVELMIENINLIIDEIKVDKKY